MASAVLKPYVSRDAEVAKLAAKAADRAAAVASDRADVSGTNPSVADATTAETAAVRDGGFVGPLELRCTAGDAARAWFARERVQAGAIILSLHTVTHRYSPLHSRLAR